MRLFFPITLSLGFATFGAITAGGCGGVALPPGAVVSPGGAIPGAPTDKCSADGTYWIVTAADCGFLQCPNMTGPAYALCTGTTFSACTCTQPTSGSGWEEIPGEGPPDSGMYPDIEVPDTYVPPHDSGHDTGGDSAADTGSEAGSEAGSPESGSTESGGSG